MLTGAHILNVDFYRTGHLHTLFTGQVQCVKIEVGGVDVTLM